MDILKMHHETYASSRASGAIEYGFTFKLEGSDDSEFDLCLGEVAPVFIGEVQAEYDKHRWAADAIVEAYNAKAQS